jgi:hypothetical protein
MLEFVKEKNARVKQKTSALQDPTGLQEFLGDFKKLRRTANVSGALFSRTEEYYIFSSMIYVLLLVEISDSQQKKKNFNFF